MAHFSRIKASVDGYARREKGASNEAPRAALRAETLRDRSDMRHPFSGGISQVKFLRRRRYQVSVKEGDELVAVAFPVRIVVLGDSLIRVGQKHERCQHLFILKLGE